MGLTLTRDDITQREFVGLLQLKEERDKFQAQQARYQEALVERDRDQPHGAAAGRPQSID